MNFDVVVIGGGAAGLSAAMNVARSGKSVLVIEKETMGGQIATSPKVENYPTIAEISGAELADRLFEQAMNLGAQFEPDEVVNITKTDKGFAVKTDYTLYNAKAVIFAAGAKHKHMPFERGEALPDGVSYCAICDGAFHKGEEVAVIGDGNSAVQYALLLANYCPRVAIFTLFDRFFADKMLVDRLKAKDNIVVYPETCVTGYIGEAKLEGFHYKDKDGVIHEYRTGALFVAIGQVPDNKLIQPFTRLDKDGFAISDENCLTDTDGLYVAGDCRTKSVRQVVTAVADGAVAALAAVNHCDSETN